MVGVVILTIALPIDVGDVTDDGADDDDDDDDTVAVATTATDVKSVADAVTTGNNVDVCCAVVRPVYSNICFVQYMYEWRQEKQKQKQNHYIVIVKKEKTRMF